MPSARRVIVEDTESNEEEETETEETEEEKPEPEKKPVKAKVSEKKPVKEEDTESEYVECPDCDAQIRRDRLGNHRFKMHKVDCREADREKTGEVDLDAPEKVTKKEKGTAANKKKKTGVSRGWFGDRAE